MADALNEYIKGGHRTVDGWLAPLAMEVIARVSELQGRLGIRGPACEIGVHHGKLFILLHLLTDRSEKSVAWDLFERQQENIDRSGRGDKGRLLENLHRNGCDVSRIEICTQNSLRLTAEQILEQCEGRPRLFSVDGGHTAEIAFNDLSLAARTICRGGIIIVDDVFNELWPGVTEGTFRYLHSESGLIPVVIARNKFLLTNDSKMAEGYIEALTQKRRGLKVRKSAVLGSDVLILTQVPRNLRNVVADSALWRLLGETSLGRIVKRGVTR